jgi:hypothetical protein
MTTTTDQTVVPDTGSVSLVDRFKQLAERLRARPQPVEIPPPITAESILKNFGARYPGYREQLAARKEATRQEVSSQFVPYDDGWKSLVSDYKRAHPNTRGILEVYHLFELKRGASNAEQSGDARDLGVIWFKNTFVDQKPPTCTRPRVG